MLKKILIGFVIFVLIFVLVVSLQPADFKITRSATIAAPPSDVFAQVNDFHKWEAWSPWVKLDPAMKQTYEGPPAGVGTIYSWIGNDKVGEGRMTLLESKPNDQIIIKLEFLKPFAATNTAEFLFKPDGDKTVVTWNMTGKNNFISKAFCMFMNMDKMVGKSFEEGLAQIKTIVESGSTKSGVKADIKAVDPKP